MPRLDESRTSLLEALVDRYGSLPPPGGKPLDNGGSDPFEVIASVALGLMTEPRLASAVLDVLRDAGLLEPGALAKVDPLELDDLFRQNRVRLAAKALRPLQKIARWASDRDFDSEAAMRLSTEAIREAWRGMNGVGPATADALLLFAFRRPTYPVDRSTYRVLVRHGWLDPSADYDEARSVVEGIAPDDAEALAQLSLALEKVGRDACKPTVARCDRCPLRHLLPEGGPIEAG